MMRDRLRGPITFIACSSAQGFMKESFECLKARYATQPETEKHLPRICDSTRTIFSNTEIKTVINDVIRGSDLYVFQLFDDPCSDQSVNDNLMELISLLDAAFYSDPQSVTVIIPHYPYARQERRNGREPITAKIVAQMLEIGQADRVISLDVHAEAICGFFRKTKFETIRVHNEISRHLKPHINTENLVTVAPDVGSASRGRLFSQTLKTDMAIIDKCRDMRNPSTIEKIQLVGDVNGKDALIVDDMIGTGGTIIHASEKLKESGAHKIYVACTFPFFNGSACQKLEKAFNDGIIEQVFGTNAVWHHDSIKKKPWYTEIAMTPLLSHIIYNIHHGKSISALLEGS